MRTILSSICFVALFSCSNEPAVTEVIETEITETIEKSAVIANASVQLAIEGMVCSKGCAGTIEKELASQSGIEACIVNFDEATAEVRFDSTQVSKETIRSLVAEIGEGTYSASIL
jgi:periplasmic mercuric ion binding protein